MEPARTAAHRVNTETVGPFPAMADAEPWDYFERVKELGGVAWDEGAQAYLVCGHELLREVARADNRVWRHMIQPNSADGSNAVLGLNHEQLVEFEGSPNAVFLLNGEAHRRVHRWWVDAFSADLLEEIAETTLMPIAQGELDRVADRGWAELVSEWVLPTAVKVNFAVIGLPVDDEFVAQAMPLFVRRTLIHDQEGLTEAERKARIADGMTALHELHDLLLPHVAARRDGTRNDLISVMWRDGERVLGDDWAGIADVMGIAFTALDGSVGSLASGVASALYLLIERPGLQEELRQRGQIGVRNFIEETLRLYSPITYRFRTAREDTELGGVRIAKGEAIIALGASASRDEGRYRCPDEVDLERTSPRDHWAFQKGVRACPGQALARVETEVAVKAALERLPHLRLDPKAPEAPRFTGLLLRRWEPLHAVWETTQPAA